MKKKRELSKSLKSCLTISVIIISISTLWYTDYTSYNYFGENFFVAFLTIYLNILIGFIFGIFPGTFGAIYGSIDSDGKKITLLNRLVIIILFSGFSVFTYYFTSRELNFGIFEYLGFLLGTTYSFIFFYTRIN